jgi:hypothetical protein
MDKGIIKGFSIAERMNGFANFVIEKEDGSQVLVPMHISKLAEIAEFELEHDLFIPIIGREVMLKNGKISDIFL